LRLKTTLFYLFTNTAICLVLLKYVTFNVFYMSHESYDILYNYNRIIYNDNMLHIPGTYTYYDN